MAAHHAKSFGRKWLAKSRSADSTGLESAGLDSVQSSQNDSKPDDERSRTDEEQSRTEKSKNDSKHHEDVGSDVEEKAGGYLPGQIADDMSPGVEGSSGSGGAAVKVQFGSAFSAVEASSIRCLTHTQTQSHLRTRTHIIALAHDPIYPV